MILVMKNYKKKAICMAVGVALSIPAAVTMAAEVGNFFHVEGKSKLQVGVFYGNSRRDVEQKGSANVLTEVESFSEPEFTETTVEKFDINGLDAEQETDDLYLKVSYALTPTIEVYGKAGLSKTELDIDNDSGTIDYSGTETISEAGEPDIVISEGFSESTADLASEGVLGGTQKSDTGWLVGVGTKITLFSANGWNLGLDGQYIYREQDVGESFLTDFIELDDNESHELQASLMLGKVVGNFRPYGGISYTKFESEYDLKYVGDDDFPDFISAGNGQLEFENEDNIGYFAGFDYDVSGLTASFELRGGDEESATLGLRMDF